jgi:membrane dipeptidase
MPRFSLGWLTVLVPVGAMLLAGPAAAQAPAPGDAARFARVKAILADTPLVDGHNDLAENLRDRWGNHLDRVDLSSDLAKLDDPLQTDIPRLRAGMVGGLFFAAFVSPDLEGPAAVQVLLEQLDVIRRVTVRYPNDLTLALTATDVEHIHRQGKIAALIGIEGGQGIGSSLAVLRMAHLCGARYLTLTHWKSIAWADAGTDSPHHNGLTPFGREVVRELNRLGMLVDLSHVSDKVMSDALDISAAPVVFSHSSARAVCNHPRNVPDAILKRVAANDGIVMVNFAPGFVSDAAKAWDEIAWPERERIEKLYPGDKTRAHREFEAWKQVHPAPEVTLAQVADHIDHIRAVAGVNHVGLGSDFDGIGRAPVGLEDVSCYPALLAELAKRGYTDDEIRKVAGANILRVMRKVEEVAVRLQKERPAPDVLIDEVDRPAQPVVEHSGASGAAK